MYKNSTQVPNTIFDIHLPNLKESELKVLLIITRQTNGWINKKTGKRKVRDRISRSQFVKKTGLSRRTVSTALQTLVEKKLIQVTDYKGKMLRYPFLRQGKTYLFYSLETNTERHKRSYKVLHLSELL